MTKRKIALILASILMLTMFGCNRTTPPSDTDFDEVTRNDIDTDDTTLPNNPPTTEPSSDTQDNISINFINHCETVSHGETRFLVSFIRPEEWDNDNGGILNDENDRKRIGNRVVADFIEDEEFTTQVLSDNEAVIANPTSPYKGNTDSDIPYLGYRMEVFPGATRYCYILQLSESYSMYFDLWAHSGDDINNFYDEYILPILNSVTVYIDNGNGEDKLALRYKAFSGIVGFKPGDGSVWAERSADLAVATDEYFAEYGNDVASRPPLVYYLVQKMGLSKSEMYALYCPDVLPDFVDYLFIGDTEEAKRALMTDYSFYADGKVYTFYEVYNAEMAGEPLFDITESDHAVVWWNIYDYLQRQNTYRQRGGDYIPFVEEIITENFTTITDIADWETLGLRKEYSGIYSFLWGLLGGESDIPEYNELGIKDYSLTRLYELNSAGTTVEFTFTVTGNSLPETLPPGTYSKIVEEGIDVFIFDNKKPETWDEYEEEEQIQRGLAKFGDNPAVQAVNTYLSWTVPYEVSPYGEWDMTNYHLPYSYICAYYGNEHLEISFSELQRLMSEKFGIAVERPQTEMVHSWSICLYDSETDTIRYADTRGITAVHRFLDVREEDGITYVIVQLFADRNRLIPSHKVQYAIGEGEVFLGSEIIEKGNYEPRDIS